MNNNNCPVHENTQVNLIPKSTYKNGVVTLTIDEYNPQDHKHSKVEMTFNLNELFPKSTPVQRLVLGTMIRLGTLPPEFIGEALIDSAERCRDVDLAKLNGKEYLETILAGFNTIAIDKIDLITGAVTGSGYKFFNEADEQARLQTSRVPALLYNFLVNKPGNDISSTGKRFTEIIDGLSSELASKNIIIEQCYILMDAYVECKVKIREHILNHAFVLTRHNDAKQNDNQVPGLLVEYLRALRSVWPGLRVTLDKQSILESMAIEYSIGMSFLKDVYNFFTSLKDTKNIKGILEFNYSWDVVKIDAFYAIHFREGIITPFASINIFEYIKADGSIIYIPVIPFGTCPFFSGRWVNWKAIIKRAKTVKGGG